jgi:tetratricopeptide (TPR) repeat protein
LYLYLAQAESSYILGRTFQKQGDFGQAFHYYFQAVRFDPGFAPAQYGLGQMYVLRNDLDQVWIPLDASYPLPLKPTPFDTH